MRIATESEAAVVRDLLASRTASDLGEGSESRVGSRSFRRISKRAYTARWVYDRFLPDLSTVGVTSAVFVIARPFADVLESVRARWAGLSSNVLLWKWPDVLFGAFLCRESTRELLPLLGLGPGRWESWVVACDLKVRSIPVYFDFEGAWARVAGLQGTIAYPHSLPTRRTAPGRRILDSRSISALTALVARPLGNTSSSGPLRVSSFFLPRAHQQLLRVGAVERRTFLNLGRAPPGREAATKRVAFLFGELRSPAAEAELFGTLMALPVFPFLYASDGTSVVLAAVSPGPKRPLTQQGLPSVLGSLERLMKDIRILREPIEELQVEVDHRYDRLLPSAGTD
jgi:hypothetical protein